ncbi:MAG: hypothetical protein A3A24_01850 [Candidatus Buchananbacteria bacterium RIFCSPLOWO2_01_FULL_46_12]|uniref:Uncharacterized protein n=2 Tax=Candidatus Buchananiibacteriota TaxID=1817903 RepID=A0A1G1YMS4_9BACT|nr:MAG: hypothetical protein A2744_00450 [Candidatus Buchananbacteria bacterium RIFCSPHIGHO2_01_FULL_44_11]OGY53663.1 MAG: hypothetical protein A3A24_01850 [Candidatus Buchananbacteria bacterium RIFCSPLOWO2_01_FULL_46_12]
MRLFRSLTLLTILATGLGCSHFGPPSLKRQPELDQGLTPSRPPAATNEFGLIPLDVCFSEVTAGMYPVVINNIPTTTTVTVTDLRRQADQRINVVCELLMRQVRAKVQRPDVRGFYTTRDFRSLQTVPQPDSQKRSAILIYEIHVFVKLAITAPHTPTPLPRTIPATKPKATIISTLFPATRLGIFFIFTYTKYVETQNLVSLRIFL